MKRSSEGRSSKPIPVAIYKGTPWAVYSSSSGKKYFFNYETNISQWEMPRELKSMKASSVKRETHETYLSSFERTYDQELHKDDERHICPQPKPEPKSSKITVSLIELPHIGYFLVEFSHSRVYQSNRTAH
ncbi:Pre-mRNA-processing protein 40C [Thelohanellus kitauei]|uniref:Pre-mRNA-processing protein 40C n=1 Tax=Thelohanellus kitauei TaxID=669202 RepID=A0A0C2MWC0_THEKT|nr:Pre-mRNA-processing protein 40C [Thelohanellus kitauei]